MDDLVLRLALTSASAVIAESATFPIDITKTRLQLQGEKSGDVLRKNHLGALHTAAGIAREEGFTGLYRGLSPALMRHILYTSIRISSYEQMRNWFHKEQNTHLSVADKALMGGASGIIGQVIASPADLIKVRMQADGRLVKLGQEARYKGLGDAFYKIVSQEGVRGLWRGVGPNAQRAFLVNMGELACYDQAKHAIINRGVVSDGLVAHSLASVMSGLCATVLSCPADVVKTRMMNQAGGGRGVYKNSLDCLVKTVRSEGVSALWKGFVPTWTRLGPWQLVFWVSYEQLRRFTGLSSF